MSTEEKLIRCTKCLELKPISSYTKRLDRKSGHRSSCKDCSNTVSLLYKKSKEGHIRVIFTQQKRSSKKRGHKEPDYSLDEFRKWMYAQDNFENLYNNWVLSNYCKKLTPSVDRIDDLKPYSFTNIRLVTWCENNIKASQDKLNGVTGRDMKTVYQYDEGFNLVATYHSTSYASKELNVSQTCISLRCRKYPKIIKGFYWTYNKLH